ncbi:MAG: hypothetical protein ACE5K9_08470 [Candidatus Methylomirabilales bacterium]
MSQPDFSEITSKANEAWSETLNKALDTFSLAGEVQRDLSGRTVDVNAAIAREGVQYLDEVQGAIRRTSEEARELLNRQWAVAQEFPKDPMGFPQKVVTLYWEEGEKFTQLGDAQVEALTRFTGKVQDLVEQAGKETRESLTKYTEKILALYGLKN